MIFARRSVETQAAARATRRREDFHLGEAERARAVYRILSQRVTTNRTLGGEEEVDEGAPQRPHD